MCAGNAQVRRVCVLVFCELGDFHILRIDVADGLWNHNAARLTHRLTAFFVFLRQPVQVFVNPRGSEARGRGAGYPHQPFILILVMSLRFGRVVWNLEEGWGGFSGVSLSPHFCYLLFIDVCADIFNL